MAHLRGRSTTRLTASVGILVLTFGLAGLLSEKAGGPLASARADTGDANYTVTASTDSQADVSAPGPLTGLVNGETVNVTITGSGTFNVNGAQLRLCETGVEIDADFEFDAGIGPNCIFPGFTGESDFFTEGAAPAPFTTVTLGFRVGTGTNTHEWDDGSGVPQTATISCGPGDPCALWVRVGVDLSVVPITGNLWYHFDLQFGEGSGDTTTTTPATTSTTAPAATTTTAPGATSTTAPGATSTTAPGSTSTTRASTTSSSSPGASTTTTVPDIAATPSSLAAGDNLNVTTIGWKADSTITATLSSTPVSLGTLTANGTGRATGALRVPADMAAGTHTLVLTGTGADGNARELRATVTVTERAGVLARAGASIGRLLFSGFALVVAGALLVVTAVRRQRILRG